MKGTLDWWEMGEEAEEGAEEDEKEACESVNEAVVADSEEGSVDKRVVGVVVVDVVVVVIDVVVVVVVVVFMVGGVGYEKKLWIKLFHVGYEQGVYILEHYDRTCHQSMGLETDNSTTDVKENAVIEMQMLVCGITKQFWSRGKFKWLEEIEEYQHK